MKNAQTAKSDTAVEHPDYAFGVSELIVAKLSGAITPEQERELEEWCSASPKNAELYRRLENGDSLAGYLNSNTPEDYRRCLHDMRLRIRRRRVRLAFVRAGAVAAVLIPAFLFLIMPRPSSVEHEPVAGRTIEPGYAHARLTLGDGTTISLNSATEETLRIADHIFIDNDTLNYSGQRQIQTEKEIHTIEVMRGGEYFLRLADGSKVWLNSQTTLSYPSSFVGKERRIRLEGEAFFEVVADPDKPFIVESQNQQVIVLGTSFGIRVYADEQAAYTTLETGSVRLVSGSIEAKLVPGSQSVVREDGSIEIREVDPLLYTAWRNGNFVFVDQELGEILRTLSRWYDVNVLYSHPGLDKLRVTGELKRNASIDTLFEKIESMGKVKFDIHDRTVLVKPS